MTTAEAFLEARPRLRPDIVLGPGVRKGPSIVHQLKDPRVGRYFQVGEREFFIMSRLDGARTLGEISADYAAAFHRQLGERHWEQMLGMLAGRRLLVEGDSPEDVAVDADPPTKRAARERSLLHARLRLVDPERFFGRIERRVSFLFSPYFVIPALIAVVCLEVGVALTAPQLFEESRHLWSDPAAGITVVLIIWLSLALHESAHALTCTHFGGSATEIGIMWRFPVLAPYCQVNDVLLFQRRRHRVYTALAGVFSSVLLLVPVAPVWVLAPPGTTLRHAAAALLLFGSVAALINFLPFLQLDGHAMLNHALGMQNLRQDSYTFLWQLVRPAKRSKDHALAYPRHVSTIYAIYGTVSLLFGAGLVAWFFHQWLRLLEPLLGVGAALTILGGVFAIVVVAMLVTVRHRRVDAR